MKEHDRDRQILWLMGLVLALLTAACTKNEPLFERLSAEETGVTFSNEMAENDTLNIINYTNIYNGGGVAIADFNNNGLQDIYFTGLMVDNELYLNMGDFKFDNVSEEANVAAEGTWSSGVAVVDINNDGLMDIYVCATTNDESKHRTNLFYINQGVNENDVPVFREMAAEYNVADTAHTTMATFFDYDNDGDLDLFLMVNQFNRNNSMRRDGPQRIPDIGVTKDILYRNEGVDSLGHPWFREVSEEAGISEPGYGLGLNIADINRDGSKDIIIANDFFTNDLLYLNDGNGNFTDQSGQIFKHTAYAAMGNDVADLNNDGFPEVVVVDMRPEDNERKKKMIRANDYSAYLKNKKNNYDSQFVRNVLQVYQGKNPETGQPFYSDVAIHSGIAETDWSWAPLLMDFDNDGWRDILITNGFPKDMTDNDFEDLFQMYPRYLSIQDLLEQLPSEKVSNYIYRNKGEGDNHSLRFEDVTEKWGMKIPSFSYGAAQADFNNDGSLDLVVNNINDPVFIFRNRLSEIHPEENNYLRIRFEGTGDNTMGLGAHVEIEYGDGEKQYQEYTTYRGYISSVEPVVHFGLGNNTIADKLTVNWPGGKSQVIRNVESNQELTVYQKNASEKANEESNPPDRQKSLFQNITDELSIDYVHEEWDYNDFNVQPLLPHKLSQYGPGLAVGDVNSNGLNDIYISGSFDHRGVFLIQQQDGTFSEEDLLLGDDRENREEELSSLFFDADGDGDDDLFIVSGSYEHPRGDKAYQDRLFINEEGRFRLVNDALPSFLSSGSVVRAADFDRDGDLDLFVAGRVSPQRYPEPVDSYILENVSDHGEIRFQIANKEVAPLLDEFGMVSDALWTDFNNDGWVDLILAGEWMSLRFLKNDSGSFVDVTDSTGLADYKGWWNSLCGGDFDNDGDIDYIAGNIGTNTYFQADEKYPVNIYASDFDNNGMFDAIPSIYSKMERDGYRVEVPYHGLGDLTKQLPAIGEKYETNHAFARVTMDEILSLFETNSILNYQANHMETSFIENRGNGKFVITPLPDEAQWAPVYGCLAEDVNGDGNLDVVLTGNDHGMELSVSRADALNGLVLTGDGTGGFDVKSFEESGFFVPGDAKALVKLKGVNDSPLVATAQNRGPLKLFQTTQTSKIFQADDMDQSAVIHYEDGSSRKVEFYYGSSFLSSSGRFILINDNVQSIDITDFRRNTRTVSFSGDLASD